MTEKRNGPNNPATAAALTSYAELLIAQKRYAEAEPVLKRVVAFSSAARMVASASAFQAVYEPITSGRPTPLKAR